MNFEEALGYMEGLLRFGWRLGNERFEALCELLGNPQRRYPIIHVAGTKGKGSTTAIAAAILQAQGYRVGSYFSPYVYYPCERVQVNGCMIPRDDFARIVSFIRPHMEALAETDMGQTTEFELKTAIGFVYFAEQKVDFVCLEVGLGGRLDATNIVEPLVTVITNIGLDHTQILGDTHALIAIEKAGIIKAGVACFTAVDNLEALTEIQGIAAERDAPLTQVKQIPCSNNNPHQDTEADRSIMWFAENDIPDLTHFSPFTISTTRNKYKHLEMHMGGVYQRANAACAVGAVEEALSISGAALYEKSVRTGLATAELPGRLSISKSHNKALVVMDGAHNEMAAQALIGPVRALCRQHQIKRVHLVIGMLTGHSHLDFLKGLDGIADRITVCQPKWKRAVPVEEMAAAAREVCDDVRVIPSVRMAAKSALEEADAQDMVLITGSFYTVGEVHLEELVAEIEGGDE